MDTVEKIKKIKERSVAYPSVTLEEALNRLQELQSNHGSGPYSREDAARGMGYSSISGASTRAVAALVHYGLLDRSGNAYTQSKIAREILFPVSDQAKSHAITQAAHSPRLFETLIKKYAGQAIPTMLDNILIREGVSSGASKETANTFRETLKFAGLLKNGVVLTDVSGEADASQPEDGRPLQGAGGYESSGRGGKTVPGKFLFSDSGKGWNLSISSETPLTSEIKKVLVDIAEKLEQINKEAGV